MPKNKNIIAVLGVVAGIGVAMAPLSAFADTTTVSVGTDTLNVTIDTACEFQTTATSANAAFSNTYEKTVTPGEKVALDAESGTTPIASIKVVCNDAGGYQIEAQGTPLSISGGTETIPVGTPTAGTSAWGAKLSTEGDLTLASGYSSSTSAALPTTWAIVASNSDVSDDDSFQIVGYEVSTSTEQKAGTYTGTAQYRLVHPAS